MKYKIKNVLINFNNYKKYLISLICLCLGTFIFYNYSQSQKNKVMYVDYKALECEVKKSFLEPDKSFYLLIRKEIKSSFKNPKLSFYKLEYIKKEPHKSLFSWWGEVIEINADIILLDIGHHIYSNQKEALDFNSYLDFDFRPSKYGNKQYFVQLNRKTLLLSFIENSDERECKLVKLEEINALRNEINHSLKESYRSNKL
jgi:hypothetical protein